MKLWDLATQHCIQTVVVGRGEVLSAAVREEASPVNAGAELDDEGVTEADDARIVIITGTGDGEARVWSIVKSALTSGLVKNEQGEVRPSCPLPLSPSPHHSQLITQLSKLINPLTSLPLPASSAPITQISSHPTLPLLLLQTSDKVVVALRIRPDEEVLAKLARRKKRAAEKEKEKEKGKKKGKGGEEVKVEDGVEGSDTVKWEDKVAVLCTVRANAKIKSFSLGPNEGLKGGVPVR
jgi:U3 small nucleolar RNA-associated protein 12